MGNEHPILFTGEMVRAILDGRKTQTRRVIKPQPLCPSLRYYTHGREWKDGDGTLMKCPYGVSGDWLWVRETWATPGNFDHMKPRDLVQSHYMSDLTAYRATETHGDAYFRWRPSIFLPHWLARIKLGVVRVRAERVQGISEKDVLAEGFPWRGIGAELQWGYRPPLVWFQALWDRINAKRGYGWDVNPWVWAVEFEVEQ